MNSCGKRWLKCNKNLSELFLNYLSHNHLILKRQTPLSVFIMNWPCTSYVGMFKKTSYLFTIISTVMHILTRMKDFNNFYSKTSFSKKKKKTSPSSLGFITCIISEKILNLTFTVYLICYAYYFICRKLKGECEEINAGLWDDKIKDVWQELQK